MDSMDMIGENEKIALSRIKNPNILDTNINDLIATYTFFYNSYLKSEPMTAEHLNKRIGLFVYIRDKMNTKTINETIKIIENKGINSRIMELFIDEGMCDYKYVYNAVKKGYPEYSRMLEKHRKC